ncbi:MAG: flagellar hook-associated protein FlgK, partial [Planctomycetota bacterium]
MGLTASLQIGRTALTASQAAIQVTGNNLANAATPGYHRQVATVIPVRGAIEQENAFFGRGVRLQDISRQIDESLQARLRSA